MYVNIFARKETKFVFNIRLSISQYLYGATPYLTLALSPPFRNLELLQNFVQIMMDTTRFLQS